MKFLLLIAIVLLVAWLWRGNRGTGSGSGSAAADGRAAQQQEMIRCPVCSVHFPRSDALPGPDGQLYCCAEHRARAEA